MPKYGAPGWAKEGERQLKKLFNKVQEVGQQVIDGVVRFAQDTWDTIYDAWRLRWVGLWICRNLFGGLIWRGKHRLIGSPIGRASRAGTIPILPWEFLATLVLDNSVLGFEQRIGVLGHLWPFDFMMRWLFSGYCPPLRALP